MANRICLRIPLRCCSSSSIRCRVTPATSSRSHAIHSAMAFSGGTPTVRRGLAPPPAGNRGDEIRQRHVLAIPRPLLGREDSVVAKLGDEKLRDEVDAVGTHCAWVLHDHHVLALGRAVGIPHFDALEDVTSEVWPVCNDLVASCTVQPTPIDGISTAWGFEVTRHAYFVLGRIESWSSVARNTSKSDR